MTEAARPARLAISVGCPSGIGPEVSVAAAAREPAARVLLVGDEAVIARAATLRRVDRRRLVRVGDPRDAWSLPPRAIGVWSPYARAVPGRAGAPTRDDGAAQLAWIDAACDLVAAGDADALVTGPVSKDVIAGSGARGSARFLGHTEHLQRRLRAAEVVMAFWSERFTTALVTTHLPLRRVPRAITKGNVASAAYWLARLLLDLRREPRTVRVAVCGLNPHAGEAGRLGDDETRTIAPGIAEARRRLGRRDVALEGPIGAETAFRKAQHASAYDGVVAMYHDQATIPMKLVGFGESVNVSLALPIIRTSVDHGTGYDIAGKGIADPRGMREAIALAARMAGARAAASAATKRRARR